MDHKVGKCEADHFGRDNKREYYLKGENLQKSVTQMDLCVLVHEKQGTSTQVQQVIRKTNGMLALISRKLEYKSREDLLQLRKVLVRTRRLYCELV